MMATSERSTQQSRQAVIDSLSSMISKGKADVESILDKLQWSKDKILEGPDMVRCPVNSHHLIPQASLSKHIEVCQLVKEGYSRGEQKEIPHNDWFYSEAKNVISISIDQATQNTILSRVSGNSGIKLVPRTMDRIETDLNSQEKLAIYEHVVQRAKESGYGNDVSLEDLAFDPNASREKDKRDSESRAADLARQRDLKRRRQTYRAKNVHITQRSQTQIMKEIIDSQMSELEDIYQEERRRKRREEKRRDMEDDRDSRRNDRDRRRDVRKDDRRDEKRRRRRYSDESGEEESSSHERIRVKIEDEEEGEVVEVNNSRRRSRLSSRDRSLRDGTRYHRREDRSSSITGHSHRRYEERDDSISEIVNDGDDKFVRRSREESVESFVHKRQSSREGSVDSSRRDEEERRRKKKKKSDREHRSRHKHKHSHDRVRVKEEKL